MKPVLSLPDVSLVMIETLEHELARMAVEDCLRQASFGDILIFTDKPEKFSGSDCEMQPHRTVLVPNWPAKIGWSNFSWFGVPRHVHTSHALYIQWDSWIIDPGMWNGQFLDYDYIGPPWWYQDGRNVGNGGFSLRSSRLMKYLSSHQTWFPCGTEQDDDLLCRAYRPRLEQAGFVWAPEDAAMNFGFECVRPSPKSRHFGFHGIENWPAVLNREQLAERLMIARQSPYISKSYMWRHFLQMNPRVAAEIASERIAS